MGIQTILNAKNHINGVGSSKAKIIQKAIEGKITDKIPTTYLQHHHNTTLVLDPQAASELIRIKTPWLVTNCEWNENNRSKAISWLCKKQVSQF